jgi:hypothetical protein
MKMLYYSAAGALLICTPALGAYAVMAADGAIPAVNPAPTQTPEEIAKQAAILADKFAAAIAGRPATTSAADFEGILVFTISQSGATDDVALEALNRLPVGNNANLAQAVENVRQAILAKRLRRGTAAITNGGQGNFGSDGSFTNPNFSTGGGSSNYGQ